MFFLFHILFIPLSDSSDEKVRNLYCAELKNRVLNSQCYGQEGLFFQLAAYALQADLGDWKEGVEPYFTPQDYFPHWVGHNVVKYFIKSY